MGRPEPNSGRPASKLLLAIVPGLAASALAVFVLYALNMSQGPEPNDRLANFTATDDNLTAEERRELTRQMLKARRENPEVPVEVTPTPRPVPATVGTAPPEEGAPAAAAPEARPRSDRVAALPPATRVPRPSPARPEAATVNAPATTAPVTQGIGQPPTQAAPPAATGSLAPAAPPPPAPAGVRLPPVEVNATPAEKGEPEQQRGLAGNVLSSISVFAGSAANATGNTVNWVIALPGRAVSAGGRLLGRDPAPSNPPPVAPPPAAAPPPPKQNLL